jgi:hypothetical protein
MMIALALTFGVAQSLLGPAFGYPGVAEEDPAVVFAAFAADRDLVIGAFYATTLAELLRIPIAVGVLLLLPRTLLTVSLAAFGALAGVLRALDYVLWPFLVPRLADAFLDPAASAATRDAAALSYESLFSYLGDALGGNLGLLCVIVWALGTTVLLWRARLVPVWLGVWGVIAVAGISVNYVEFLGTTTGLIGTIGGIGQVAFYSWLLALGAVLAIRGVGGRDGAGTAADRSPLPAGRPW